MQEDFTGDPVLALNYVHTDDSNTAPTAHAHTQQSNASTQRTGSQKETHLKHTHSKPQSGARPSRHLLDQPAATAEACGTTST